MPREQYSDELIARALHTAGAGESIAEICPEDGVTDQAFYRSSRLRTATLAP